ncbi:hypothetical protein LCGC14_0533950 [marine sediment metagenome]|uniref:TRAM domain-containing protein n=1 Tax=marine sediment metagenome TaxID=412755 RepID=A0A0F9SDA6_9ZZZZ
MSEMMKRVYVETYGCQMNKHDAERIAGLLQAVGYVAELDVTKADLAVYYTCCVRKSADERFYGQLSSVKHKEGSIIAVGGCLAQDKGEELLKRFKKIDVVFGTQNLKELPTFINQLNGQSISDTQYLKEFNSNLPALRELKHKAWVAVNRGCDNHCSYCIVPTVRGPEVSRAIEDIETEIDQLVADNVKEVTLLGQNVNSYGKDIYSRPSFSKLLDTLGKKDINRVRFTTSHPKDLSDEILETISENENMCEHIHLPFQAGSDRVLRKMGRQYNKEGYLELVKMIRNYLPDASITTDIMVGFPTEDEKDFEDTLDIVENARFDKAFTFIYSKRDGTPAASLEDNVAYEDKLERFKRLVSLQDEISLEKNKENVGRVEELLVDSITKKDRAMLSGRTKTNKLVHFKGEASTIGSFVNVKIKEAKPFFLIGEISG